MEYGLGRIFMPDERDKNFPLKILLPRKEITRTYRYYSEGVNLDQGSTPMCVGFSCFQFLLSSPIKHNVLHIDLTPQQIYHEAQQVDEWTGESYDGTSVRAGMKVLQAHGYISSYFWASTVQETMDFLLSQGTIVFGINWYNDMFTPTDEGIIKINNSALAGGHAIVATGVNTKRGLVRLRNSWGRAWGKKGDCYIPGEDLERLIKEDGEAATALEVKKGVM